MTMANATATQIFMGMRMLYTVVWTALSLSFVACRDGPTPPEPSRATSLAFVVEPTLAEGMVSISPGPKVEVLDQFGQVDTTAYMEIRMTIGTNPGGSALGGNPFINAFRGVAQFGNVHLDRPGSGYTLVVSAPGLTSATSAPFDVRLTFAQVDAGNSHSCGVTVVGAAYCWGTNGNGQLGDGTFQSRSTPTPVIGAFIFSEVSAGGHHSCGITTTNRLNYCWGLNSDGQLGNGTFMSSPTPSLVFNGLILAHISAGDAHTCGVTTINEAHCWGHNTDGRVGDGTTNASVVPMPVTGSLAFTQISAGGSHTCGVTTSKAAYCWGENFGGQVGDGTTPTPRLTPTLVQGGLSFDLPAAGFAHSCGVTSASTAYCWGYNPSGQLGDGTTNLRASPTPVSGVRSFATVF